MSACDVTQAVRAVIPEQVTIGTKVTIMGAGLGVKKGKLFMGGIKTGTTKWKEGKLTAITLDKVPTACREPMR